MNVDLNKIVWSHFLKIPTISSDVRVLQITAVHTKSVSKGGTYPKGKEETQSQLVLDNKPVF